MKVRRFFLTTAISAGEIEKIKAAVNGHKDADRLIHMRTQYMGPDEMLVAAKVHFRTGMTTAELADAIDSVEKAIREAVPVARIIYLEPDLYEDGHVGISEKTEAHADDH